MNTRFEPRAIDASILYLLTAGAALPALWAPAGVDHAFNYSSFVVWGIAIVIVSSIGVLFHPKRSQLAAAVFYIALPALIAARLITQPLPYAYDKSALHLVYGAGFTLYFIGVGRTLEGPRGPLPREKGERRGDRASLLMLLILAAYMLFGPSFAAQYFPPEIEQSTKEGKLFFMRSAALLLAVTLALAFIPRLTAREPVQTPSRHSALRAAFYLSIALMSGAITLRLG